MPNRSDKLMDVVTSSSSSSKAALPKAYDPTSGYGPTGREIPSKSADGSAKPSTRRIFPDDRSETERLTDAVSTDDECVVELAVMTGGSKVPTAPATMTTKKTKTVSSEDDELPASISSPPIVDGDDGEDTEAAEIISLDNETTDDAIDSTAEEDDPFRSPIVEEDDDDEEEEKK